MYGEDSICAVELGRFSECQEPTRSVFKTTEEALLRMSYLLEAPFIDLVLTYRKALSMEFAFVLKDEVSNRVEELLIIGSVETILVDADRI